ncbi:hypothetical protein AKJ43_02970, partial [candidate division MSBL1 archaeon SCGC-AAA261D19]
ERKESEEKPSEKSVSSKAKEEREKGFERERTRAPKREERGTPRGRRVGDRKLLHCEGFLRMRMSEIEL